MALTYASYLKVDELLNLQERKSNPAEHDEMLFIIIHQTYELWFKQILHEVDFLRSVLLDNRVGRAIKSSKRINTILKVLVHQVDILETMTPLEFLSFRDFLESASGFQSYQFRELEFALGFKNEYAFRQFESNPKVIERLKSRYNNPTLWDDFLKYLSMNSYNIPEELLQRDFTMKIEPNKAVQDALIEVYRNTPVIADLCENFVDMDEGLQEWRYRHVKMVERTIGNKTGTGGSSGVEYLKKSLFKPVFPDLWEIRSEFETHD